MPKRILIIEDHADVLESVSYLLRASGYEPMTARNGREGLDMARRNRPDLILTDLMLPALNGYEICTMLKQDIRYSKIPVIVWSATKMGEKDAQLAKECGAEAFVLKTLEPRLLLDKIKDLLTAAQPSDPPS